jgi:hypothetical protein
MNTRLRIQAIGVSILIVLSFAASTVTATRGVPFAAIENNQGAQAGGILGILTTRGDQPILVNGVSTPSGTSIVSGAKIETPDGIEASIQLGPLGVLRISAGASLVLTFDRGTINVIVTKGCVNLSTKKGIAATLTNPDGSIRKNNSSAASVIDTCAGTGKSAGATVSKGGLFGIGRAATIAVIGGAAATTSALLVTRGTNPSPSAP